LLFARLLVLAFCNPFVITLLTENRTARDSKIFIPCLQRDDFCAFCLSPSRYYETTEGPVSWYTVSPCNGAVIHDIQN